MMSRWQRRLRSHPKVLDALMVLALVTLSFPGVALSRDGQMVPESARRPGWLLIILACVALTGHRRHPRLSALIALVCTIALAVLGFALTPLLLSPLMAALFVVATQLGHRVGYTDTAVAVVLLIGTALAKGQPGSSIELSIFGPGLWLLLPAALGAEARLRLAYTDAVRARAEFAEMTREEEARHRVAEERMRIARELHDVAAHHLALANAQASTVAHLMDREPAKAKAMVGDLSSTVTSALRELKGAVGLLRQGDDPAEPLEPPPGLALLPALIDTLAVAGQSVDIVTEGEPRPLPVGMDLTAFRIIQEALTNVARHAPASIASIRIEYADDLLRITIANDTVPQPTTAAVQGYGLIGMRERAMSLGGWLHAGLGPDGGFQVVTELPLYLDMEPTP